MRVCHKSSHELVSPVAPVLDRPEIATVVPYPGALVRVDHVQSRPHPSPIADEPYGPS